MAYPSTTYPKTEFLINGTWTDVSSYVQQRDGQGAITVSRGRANEQGRTAAQRMEFLLNNRDGRFSNRNPTGTYYGLLPRNTQARVSAGTAVDSYLRLPQDVNVDGSNASTPDAAALDVVGDLEVRVDLLPFSWRPLQGVVLMAKYKITGNQRSWALYLNETGTVALIWSPDGTFANAVTATSTAAIPATSGRLSIKATLDVVNGANKTVTFYTASSIGGSYTQLGAAVTTAGNTSVFASTAVVTIGNGDEASVVVSGFTQLPARVYAAQIYNGIAGSLVANPDFTAQTLGTTSFADSTGKTWTLNLRSRIGSDRVRFWGELSSLPQRWDKSGRDIYVPATASGVIRRLTQGASPLRSPIYRAMTRKSGLVGYWPLEDGSDTSEAASAVDGARAATLTGITSGATSGLPGSTAVTQFDDATSRFLFAPKTASATGTLSWTFYFKLAALPASTQPLVSLFTTGTATKINISVSPTTFFFELISAAGVTLDSSNVIFGSGMTPTGQWLAMNVELETSGGNVSWSARWSNVAAESFVGIGPATFAGTVGRWVRGSISSAYSANYIGSQFGHFVMANELISFVSDDTAQAANAYLGEAAGTRMLRLADEEDATDIEIVGSYSATETMGYQTASTFMDLVYECADADLGILAEGRDFLGLTYVTREALEHRLDVTLDYDAFHLSQVPEPTEDDQGISNDVTVQRTNAGSGRREITSGSMSTSAPPNGIGRYATSVTLNVSDDARLPDIASWLANVSSWDEARYPNLAVALHRSVIVADTALTARLITLDVGMTAALADLPAWLPPDDVLLLVQGYTETLGAKLWEITYNTTPAGPYNTGKYGATYGTEAGTSRYDHATSTTNGSHNSSTTSLSVALNSATPTTLDKWTTTAGSFPFDIMVAGEQMTVSNISGSTSPQTFTVTRSVNGVSKTIPAGSRVRLYRPVFWRL